MAEPFVSSEQLLRVAQRLLDERHARIEFFAGGMFAEPAWEMLLLLYLARGSQAHTADQLAMLSGSPLTTASRWIGYLELEGLVDRESHPRDPRNTFLKLSSWGEQAIEGYLRRIHAGRF